MDKKPKARVNLALDAEIWAKAVNICQEMGFTQSGFVEMMLRLFVESDRVPMAQLVGDVLKDVMYAKQKKKKARS